MLPIQTVLHVPENFSSASTPVSVFCAMRDTWHNFTGHLSCKDAPPCLSNER